MIDFYGLTSPNVQKIFIMLEECGLAYNFKPVDVWASAQHSAEFAKLNPNKKIPVIVDTDVDRILDGVKGTVDFKEIKDLMTEWQKVYAESHKNGVLVKKVDSVYLDPTDYSPIK